MKKRWVIVISIVVIGMIFLFHYNSTIKVVGQNNSKYWSKPIELKTGNITEAPDIIKVGENTIIAYQDAKNLNMLKVDSKGTILDEKKLVEENQEPMDISLFKNNDDIILNYSTSNENGRIINTLKIDENLNVESKDKVDNVKETIKISESMYAVFFENHIEIVNLKNNGKEKIETNMASKYPCVSKYKDSYILGYQKKDGNFQYAIIKDGKINYLSKNIQRNTEEVCKIVNYMMFVKDDMLYPMCEYVYKDGADECECLPIPIGKDVTIDDIKQGYYYALIGDNTGLLGNKGEVEIIDLENIKSIQGIDRDQFVMNASIPNYKERSQKQIAIIEFGELDVYGSGKIKITDVISNTKNISVYPSISEDYCVFIDCYTKDKMGLELISKNEEFKKLTLGYTNEEKKETVLATIEKMLSGVFFILLNGAKWMLIPLSIASILSIFEFKLNNKLRKLMYILVYILMYIIRAISIKSEFYNKNIGPYISQNITMNSGYIILGVISLLIMVYSYKKYSKNIDNNIMALNIAPAIGVDIIISLMIYIPLMY